MNIKCKCTAIAVFISVLSFIASIVTLCLSFPTNGILSFDYQGIIVGILSLLVTVLIGMQIYNYIAFEKRMEDKAREISDLQSKRMYERTMKEIHTRLYLECYRLIAGYVYSSEWFKAVVMHKQLLELARIIKDDVYYNQQFSRAKALSEHAENFDEITMQEFKEYILELRSLSATTGLEIEFCVELEKKFC